MSKINKDQPATIESWYYANKDYLSYYYENYPFIAEDGVTLPIDTEILQKYYINDIEKRNLEVNPAILGNYSFLFSYWLDNYPKKDSEKFKGQTTLGYIQDALETQAKGIAGAIKDTVSIGTSLLKAVKENLPLILITIGTLFVYKTFK